jgi:hypothetical protein
VVPETRPKRPPKFGPCWFYVSSKQSKTCVSFRRCKDLSLLSQPLLEKLDNVSPCTHECHPKSIESKTNPIAKKARPGRPDLIARSTETARTSSLPFPLKHSKAYRRKDDDENTLSYLFVSSPRFCDVALRALRLENLRAYEYESKGKRETMRRQ